MKIYTNHFLKNLLTSSFNSIEIKNNSFHLDEILELLKFIPIHSDSFIVCGDIKIYDDETIKELSFSEDDENHFHVDWHTESVEEALILGIQILFLLSQKFVSQGFSGIRFWLSFENPEMGRDFAIRNKLHEDGDEYYISDRLSCFRKRGNEEDIISSNRIDEYDTAVMIIDI